MQFHLKHSASQPKVLTALLAAAFFAALILSAGTVMIIDRRLLAAAGWFLAAAALSGLGLMHAWKFAGADTVGSLPLLEKLSGESPTGPLMPAASYSLAYGILALLLVGARWYSIPSEGEAKD